MDCSICAAKTKALISCAVTAHLLRSLSAPVFFLPMQKSGFLMMGLISLTLASQSIDRPLTL